MKVLRLTLLLFLIAQNAIAANGDPCDSSIFQPPIPGGPIWCYKILDDITTASGGPVALNLANVANAEKAPGKIALAIGANDCNAGTITWTSAYVEGGQAHNIPTDNTLSLAAGGDSLLIVPLDAIGGTVINASWSAVAGCTIGFKGIVVGYPK